MCFALFILNKNKFIEPEDLPIMRVFLFLAADGGEEVVFIPESVSDFFPWVSLYLLDWINILLIP